MPQPVPLASSASTTGTAAAPRGRTRSEWLARNGIRWLLKPAIWVAALWTAVSLALRAFAGELGADPIETLTLETGNAALVLLLVTLAVTPLRRATGLSRLIQTRRLLGLFTYFYALLHFGVYAVLDQGLALDYVGEDIAERPFITVGFAALVLMTPLALTSTRGWIRRLGRRWRALHRLIYVAAALGVLHYAWSVKADLRRPLVFAAILALLLLARVPPVATALSRLGAMLRSRPGRAGRPDAA